MNFPGARGAYWWYPAPGYRYAVSGTLYAVGIDGYSWASSISGSSLAYYLGFNDGWLTSQDSIGHAYGFPVRCLQE